MPEPLFGREPELHALERFLDAIGEGPGAAVVVGEPGAGKTALWSATASIARSRGYTVLACHPAVAEGTMPFSALGDLLAGVPAAALESLSDVMAAALHVAVTPDAPAGRSPDDRVVAVAVVQLLRVLARDSPVLIAVDDYQWVDPGTARVLGYAVRRVRDERIGFLACAPADDAVTVPTMLDADLVERPPARVVAGSLSTPTIAELLGDRLGMSVPPPLLQQIASASDGNALFALEIGRAIRDREVEVIPGEPLALPRSLDALLGRRIESLSRDVQELLMIAAAAAEPTLSLLTRATAQATVARRLRPAVDAGLVSIQYDQIRFTHPLVAAALYHRIPTERRRALHRRLAEVVTGLPQRARHLALGADGPDAAVADVIDEAARAAAARGDRATAALLAEQASGLTPVGRDRERASRRVRAAEHAFAAGDVRHARALLEEMAILAPAGAWRADLLRRLAEVRYRSDSVAAAEQLLARAAEEAGATGPLRAVIERDRAWAVAMCGDVGDAAQHARLAEKLAEDSQDRSVVSGVRAAAAIADIWLGAGDAGDALELPPDVSSTEPDVPIEWRAAMVRGLVLKWRDELDAALEVFDELRQSAIETGDETSLPFILAQLGEALVLGGDAARGLDLAREAASLARQSDQMPALAAAMHATALAQAHLGMPDAARTSARTALAAAESAGAVVSMMLAQSVLGFVDLSEGKTADAVHSLTPLLSWLDVVGIREPGLIRFVPDAVEALLTEGDLDRADTMLTRYELDAARLGRPTPRLAAARVRALHRAACGDIAGAATGLRSAIDDGGDAVQPLERARAWLSLGAVLRRSRQRRATIDALQTAHEQFERLGARSWANRAVDLLPRNSHDRSATKPALTAAETRVSALVAQGLTNRQAADQLFVSVRAVEVHLTSIYRKLGVKSRTQLAARLAAPVVGALEDRTGATGSAGRR